MQKSPETADRASLRFSVLSRWRRLGLAFLAGLVLSAGHAPFEIPWVIFIALPMMVWSLSSAASSWAAAWTGWAAGFGYFISSLHWIGNAFLVEPEKFLLLLPFGVAGLPAGLALFWALAFWVAHRQTRRGTELCFALPFALAVVELARSYVLTGFPWALVAYVWIDTPVAQAVSWAGPFGLMLITLLLGTLPVCALVARRMSVLAVSALCFAAIWGGGVLQLSEQLEPRDDGPILRVVQPNAPQHLKWLPGHRETYYARALEATKASWSDLGKPDIVIWPETAIFFVPAEHETERQRMAEAADGATLILGAFHREQGPDGVFLSNALQTLLPSGEMGPRYDKHHLVPFGEYVPFRWIFDAFGIETFAGSGGFSRGSGPETLRVAGVPAFSAIICYEAIFPYEAVGDERPDWIAQITNDAWFGSWAGPQQHLAQARFRAIEQGLPVVRSTNTGISAVIDAYGRIVTSIPMHQYNHVDAVLPAPRLPTLYSIFGDLPAICLIVIFTALASLPLNIFRWD